MNTMQLLYNGVVIHIAKIINFFPVKLTSLTRSSSLSIMGGQLHGAQELMVRRFAISSENKKGAREGQRWLGPRVILKGVDSACEEQNQRFISAYREASERAFRGEKKGHSSRGCCCCCWNKGGANYLALCHLTLANAVNIISAPSNFFEIISPPCYSHTYTHTASTARG